MGLDACLATALAVVEGGGGGEAAPEVALVDVPASAGPVQMESRFFA